VPKLYIARQNSHTKDILGMSTSPRNDLHCQKLCHLSCTPITNTPEKYPFSVVWGRVKPLCRNSKILERFMHVHTNSRLLFKNDHNRCRISGWKSALYWWQKKTKRFGILRWNSWGDFPYFLCECAPSPTHLYSWFHPDPFRFGGRHNRKTHDSQSKCKIG